MERNGNLNMKKTIAVALLIIILIGVYIYYPSSKDESVLGGSFSVDNAPITNEIKQINTKDSISTVVNEQRPEDDQLLIISEKNDWLREHGYVYMFNTDGSINHIRNPVSDYDLYSSEDLAQMAISDPKASLVLGSRLAKLESHDEAYPYLYESAIRGYARGITELSDSFLSQAKESDKNQQTGEANQKLVEAFAWGHVLNLRFRPDSEPVVGSRLYMDPVRLEKIKESAKERAKKIYLELKTARNNLGLGEFNNYIPESMKDS